MTIEIINETIKRICENINKKTLSVKPWWLRTEEELIFEASACMFSSQMRYEVSEGAAKRLLAIGLFSDPYLVHNKEEYERKLREALSDPVAVEIGGERRYIRPRFKNRMASMLADTLQTMQARGQSLRAILCSSNSARDARARLIAQVRGFGPKQASLFLRRVGYSDELAVLDVHVLDYLKLARGINPKRSSLGRLSKYEMIEAEFQRLAAELGYSVGCVDLATWVTVRVAKKEAIW